MDAAEQEETEQLYREEYLKRVDDICLFDGVEIGIKRSCITRLLFSSCNWQK
jgi:hypothetical protein